MKRIISTTLALVMFLSAVACGSTPDTTISATASAAEQVLIDRLGEIPENVVLGDAAVAAEYGIDMTNFESDGYILRTVGETTLVFGKTEAGLDRAVRYYANYVHGNDAPADVTFGEGARVDRFTIEGHDISEYVITVTEAHPEGSYPVSTNYAAEEFAGFIKEATGVVVPIVAETDLVPGTPYFRFTCDGSGDNGEEGFTVTVTPEGNVEILGGLKRGCLYAACDIAEKWLGMRFMLPTYIYEAEHIEITEADSYKEVSKMVQRAFYGPALDANWPNNSYGYGFATNPQRKARNKFNDEGYEIYGYIPRQSIGGHGLWKYWGCDAGAKNPCMTDEGILLDVLDKLEKELIAAKESGALYKGNYYHVALGHNDNGTFCYCNDCTAIVKEAGTYSEVNARYVKTIADTFAEEYPEAQFFILAYSGLEKPCQTVLPDNISVTYCIQGSCYRGTIDGATCIGDGLSTCGYTVEEERENILGWNNVTKNLSLWIYYFSFNMDTPKNNLAVMYDDIQYIYNVLGIRSIFVQWEDTIFSIDRPGSYVISKLLWNPEMSREEYDSILDEAMRITYGDGYRYIYEYLDVYSDLVYCSNGNWGVCECAEIYYDKAVVEGEYILYLFDEAIRLAGSSQQQLMAEVLSTHAAYNVLVGLYRAGYTNGTDEQKAEYSTLLERVKHCIILSDAKVFSCMGSPVADVDWNGDPYEWIQYRG